MTLNSCCLVNDDQSALFVIRHFLAGMDDLININNIRTFIR